MKSLGDSFTPKINFFVFDSYMNLSKRILIIFFTLIKSLINIALLLNLLNKLKGKTFCYNFWYNC